MAEPEGQTEEPLEKKRSEPIGAYEARILSGLIERDLVSSKKGKRYVEPEKLARLLRAEPPQLLQPLIREYLCDVLQGRVRKPLGRPEEPLNANAYMRLFWAAQNYRRFLAWLQKRQRSRGLEGWCPIKEADWWQGPPHERAARMAAKRYRGHIDWRRLRNLIVEIESDSEAH